MAPAEAEEALEAVAMPEFDTSGVLVASLPELGGSSALSARSFRAGERVFCERALVVASATTNLARVRAYCGLSPDDRAALREQFFGEAPAVRCAATAACRPEAAGSGDSAAEAFEALAAEGYSWLSLEEAEAVIRVWNLNAYDCALAPVACKVAHSCAPNVFVSVDAERGAIEARACRAIAEGEALGSWYFQDTGLWWMGTDVRRAIFETDRGFLCACARCCAPDGCRALPCDACGKGYLVPEGMGAAAAAALPMAWQCAACGHSAPASSVRLGAEAELAPRALLELRPPKGAPRASPEELLALEADACTRLGTRHWVSAAAALVLHFRGRLAGGGLDAFSVASGCRFVGWLVDRALPTPPAAIVRTPISIAIDCAEWLTSRQPGSEGPAQGRGDRRCIAARLLTQFLLPVFDVSGAPVAKVAKTGARVEALRAWLGGLRNSCGRCGKILKASTGTLSAESPSAGAAPPAALACSRCRQVRYCSKECQQADWKERHKAGCLPASESLAGEAAQRLLLAPP